MYTVCAAAISLFALQVHGYANPGSCSGACNVHDPGLIQRDDGVYFRFSTGNKISYAQSSSIEGPWTAVGSVVPDGSSIDKAGNDDLWVCGSAVFPLGFSSPFFTCQAYSKELFGLIHLWDLN